MHAMAVACKTLGVSVPGLHMFPEKLRTCGFSVTPILVCYTRSHIEIASSVFAFSSFVGLGGKVKGKTADLPEQELSGDQHPCHILQSHCEFLP